MNTFEICPICGAFLFYDWCEDVYYCGLNRSHYFVSAEREECECCECTDLEEPEEPAFAEELDEIEYGPTKGERRAGKLTRARYGMRVRGRSLINLSRIVR